MDKLKYNPNSIKENSYDKKSREYIGSDNIIKIFSHCYWWESNLLESNSVEDCLSEGDLFDKIYNSLNKENTKELLKDLIAYEKDNVTVLYSFDGPSVLYMPIDEYEKIIN
jgi:hypothetical protein